LAEVHRRKTLGKGAFRKKTLHAPLPQKYNSLPAKRAILVLRFGRSRCGWLDVRPFAPSACGQDGLAYGTCFIFPCAAASKAYPPFSPAQGNLDWHGGGLCPLTHAGKAPAGFAPPMPPGGSTPALPCLRMRRVGRFSSAARPAYLISPFRAERQFAMSRSSVSRFQQFLGRSPFGYVRHGSLLYWCNVVFSKRVIASFQVAGFRFIVGWPFGIRLFSRPAR
jgi:hypothetical protein